MDVAVRQNHESRFTVHESLLRSICYLGYCLPSNMKPAFLPLITCLNLIAGVQAACQVVDKPFVINYDKGIYGGGNQNWSVAVASQGMVYAGNDKGLLQFDGSNWNLYRMPDQGIVRAVASGEGGKIYVGSYEEFGFWQPDETGRLNYTSLSSLLVPPGSLHNDEIWRIIPHNGKIYFQSFSNIFIYDGSKIDILSPSSSMVLLIRAGDRLFVHQVGRGLYEIIDDMFRMIPGSEIFAAHEVKVVLPFGGNRLLVGASGMGLFLFDGAGFSFWESPVSRMISDHDLNNGISGFNRMVIGTIGDGLYILDEGGKLIEHLNSMNFLQNNTVLSLAFDFSGNIWAGLDRGLDLISFNAGMDFYVDPSGTMGSVYAAVLDDRDLLVGTNEGLYRYSFLEGVGYTGPVAVPGLSGQVWDLKNFDGEILCGHNDGTYRVKREGCELVSEINGGFELKRIQDRNRDILLQSTYSAFSVFSHVSGSWEFSNPVTGFYEPITNFEVDHLGNVWCTHATRGVFCIRMKSDLSAVDNITLYGKNEGLPSDRQSQLIRMEGRIVFPTGQGLYLWDDLNDTIVPFTQLNVKLGEFQQSRQILKARENHYWMVLNNEAALFRITGFELQELFRYDLGMQGVNLTSRFTRIISLKEGLHLICLDNGFALFDESHLRNIPQLPPLSITGISTVDRDGKITRLPVGPASKPVRIPYASRNLSISFSAGPGFRMPLYRTRLEGLESDWTPWNSLSVVNFTRLPGGDYRFCAEARNINGTTGNTASYPFIIGPPWYNSWLAYILYGCVVILVLFLLRVNFMKRLRRHKLKIEQEETLKREQEQLRTKQEMIRLKTEKLEAEVNFKNIQLADFTMSVIKRNEQLRRIRDELQKQGQSRTGISFSGFISKITHMIDHQLTSGDDWQTFETHFDQAHQDFIKRLKTSCPELTQSDLKLCAYLRLNITTKEIAHLLNISVRGVEVRRYRLRKRLKMNTQDNLYDFLLNY